MKWFWQKNRPNEQRSLATPSPLLLEIFGSKPTAAGVSVSATTALRSPTTLAACRAISESVGSLPFHLFRRGNSGARERDTDHPAAALLAGDWCPWAGGVETRTALQLDGLLHGAGYALVIRVNGQPRELHRLIPTSVTRDTTGPEPRFRVQDGSVEKIYRWQDILYLPTPGSADGRLVCLIDLCREAIALDLVMAEHQARIFANGGRPSGILSLPGSLAGAAVERIRKSWKKAFGGERSGDTAVLEAGIDFKPLTFSSVDLQFIDLRRLAVQEIARAFKVPGTLIGDLDRATWRNVEELMRQYIQTCLMPWTEIWQSALERALLTQEERSELFVEAVFDDMLRGDLAARFTAYRQASGGSWLTPNEIRSFDNRPPIAGGDELIRQAGQGGATEPEGAAA
ncbi:phage portal protein [Chelatococcus sp.]|uniref:phage portal protein n=1 Tax=Chelatococcus sp. TaxID=1953771 RepID=UPI00224BC069|nr:Phage portal protein, HK97 family [Hyphomicrobiales bacterium]CAH1682544.1 Phage portal protein, HK97 family [Hyphomicrobiales bacterium]